MAACTGAHFWAGERAKLGHDLRLMPPSCGKPYVKRGKTKAADAGAIAEAASRPSLRFVPVKTEAQQAILTRRRSRDVLARPLTQGTTAIRAPLATFGSVVPKGVRNVERPLTLPDEAALPESADHSVKLLGEQFRDTLVKIEDVTAETRKVAENDEAARGDAAGRLELPGAR